MSDEPSRPIEPAGNGASVAGPPAAVPRILPKNTHSGERKSAGVQFKAKKGLQVGENLASALIPIPPIPMKYIDLSSDIGFIFLLQVSITHRKFVHRHQQQQAKEYFFAQLFREIISEKPKLCKFYSILMLILCGKAKNLFSLF